MTKTTEMIEIEIPLEISLEHNAEGRQRKYRDADRDLSSVWAEVENLENLRREAELRRREQEQIRLEWIFKRD